LSSTGVRMYTGSASHSFADGHDDCGPGLERLQTQRVRAGAAVPATSESYITPQPKPLRSGLGRLHARKITKFSADEFEGRAPATPGDDKARRYLVEQLQDIGFAPPARIPGSRNSMSSA